jgi:hypothetical protein
LIVFLKIFTFDLINQKKKKMNSSAEPQAFGAGRAGSNFDPIEFIKKPQVILRIVAWVCNN